MSRIFIHFTKKIRTSICLIFFIPVSLSVFGQSKVSGVVFDGESGKPIMGVTVGVKGSGNGTFTNNEGYFEIQTSPEDSLVLSSVGYMTKTEGINGRKSIEIKLNSSSQQLTQLVVVGYGQQKQTDVTGSIGTMKMESVRERPITNATQALAGQIAGVNISTSNGIPGGGPDIKIRGIGGIGAGSQPLYVVDGFPLQEENGSTAQVTNPLSNIPPDDIESISVLKDASATAIYGSRGANGVIIITTKKGTSGKLRFNLDVYTAWQKKADFDRPKIMDAEQFATFMKERIEDQNALTGSNDPIPAEYQNPASLGKGTNWYDAITRTAPMQNYNLSMNGGNDKISSYSSVSYTHQDGVVIGTDFDRYSFRSNISAQLFPEVKVGVNLAPTYSKGNSNVTGGQGRYETGFGEAIVSSPLAPIYNPDGSYNVMVGSPGTFSYPNPVMVLKETRNKHDEMRILANAFVEYNIIEGLTLKSTINVDWFNSNRETFRPSTLGNLNVPPPSNQTGGHFQNGYVNWANENTLSYNKEFNGRHVLSAVVGISEQRQDDKLANFDGSEFAGDEIQTLNTAATITGQTFDESWAMASYYGRVNYSYNDKYLVTGTFRRDGSSRFGQNNRWANFPSVALGWRISQEPWLENVSWMENLKLRVSWGETGNDQIGNFTYLGQVGINNYVLGGNNLAHGATLNTLSNPNLTWQDTKEIDLGLDFEVLKSRLSFNFDFYRRRTNSLLLNLEVPFSSGFGNAIQNIGEVQNMGIEVSINSININSDNFRWTTNLNFSHNRNKTLTLGTNNEPIQSGTSGEGHFTNITVVGQPVGMFYGYEFLGLYKNQEDVDNSAHFPGAIPGNMKVADINDDGVITPISDFTIIGNPYPKVTYGMTNMFSYGNLSLQVLLQGELGGEKMKASYEYFHNIDGVFNVLTDVIDRFHSEADPGNGLVPTTAGPSFARVMYRDNSSLWIYKSSYLWFKNISLSWNLPRDVIHRIRGINNLQLYGSIDNAFMITNYPGNPAVTHYANIHDNTGDALTPGLDFTSYPVPRVFTVGVKIGF